MIVSGDVSFQNREQRTQIGTALGRAGRAFDAGMQMGFKHFLAERLQRASRGNHLHQHIRTVGVGFHHFFDGLNLALDFSQTDDKRPFLQTGTAMFNFHGKTFNTFYRERHSKNGA